MSDQIEIQIDGIKCNSLEDAETHIRMLKRNVAALQKTVQEQFELLDTFVQTPAWKRWLFIIDGWSGHKIVDRPKWRPWRRWWTS